MTDQNAVTNATTTVSRPPQALDGRPPLFIVNPDADPTQVSDFVWVSGHVMDDMLDNGLEGGLSENATWLLRQVLQMRETATDYALSQA